MTAPEPDAAFRFEVTVPPPLEPFDPGYGGPHRFSFFGDPPVPVLYAAQTENAAVCESLLHDIPLTGGRLIPEHYERSVSGAVETTRELRLAVFHGVGLRRLGVEPIQLTSSPAGPTARRSRGRGPRMRLAWMVRCGCRHG